MKLRRPFRARCFHGNEHLANSKKQAEGLFLLPCSLTPAPFQGLWVQEAF